MHTGLFQVLGKVVEQVLGRRVRRQLPTRTPILVGNIGVYPFSTVGSRGLGGT